MLYTRDLALVSEVCLGGMKNESLQSIVSMMPS